jgi:hypothetical protein
MVVRRERNGVAVQLWELQARESVRHTIAAYSHAGDRGRADDLAQQFTEDGVLELGGGKKLVGREQVAGLIRRTAGTSRTADTGRTASAPAEKTTVRHHVSSIYFTEVTPERAAVQSYFAVFTQRGADHWGRYFDVLVPVGDRWLFAHRVARTEAHAPDSIFLGD